MLAFPLWSNPNNTGVKVTLLMLFKVELMKKEKGDSVWSQREAEAWFPGSSLLSDLPSITVDATDQT